MRKSKRWEVEDVYYGSGTKFDRNYVKAYEGTHMPIHRFRDRRNWKSSRVGIHSKYTEGLLLKYINKPIKALEEAYNRRVKDIPNAESFERAYDYLIEEFNHRHWRSRCTFKYVIEDGILIKNPNYESRHYYRKRKLKGWQFNYNTKHIKNPGAVRSEPTSGYWFRSNTGMKDRKPIPLGKLYVEVGDYILFANVYHYFPEFLDNHCLDRDNKLQAKKERFESEWIKVNTGIKSLDYYKEEPNPRRTELERMLKREDLSAESIKTISQELKWASHTIKNNYGIGRFLYTVCKIKELEEILNSSQH